MVRLQEISDVDSVARVVTRKIQTYMNEIICIIHQQDESSPNKSRVYSQHSELLAINLV